MGFWDRLLGAKKPEESDRDDLRAQLFERAARGDSRGLVTLCRERRSEIARLFPEWKTAPADIRSQPDAARRYAEGLIAIVMVFERELGDRSLAALLMGDPAKNPIMRWQAALGAIRKQLDALEYAQAIDALRRLLAEIEGLTGTGLDRFRAVGNGWLGEAHFHSGAVAESVEPTVLALALCKRQGDDEGVVAYLGNLYEIQRYLGRGAEAADAAARLADVLEGAGQRGQAERFRRRAATARACEPLNRLVAHIEDGEYELDAMPLVRDTRVRFEFRRNRITLRPAVAAVEQGRRAGSAGDFETALAHFQRAAAADPCDPQAPYEAAFTLLHLRRYGEARDLYDRTEALAPGWFHCRADRHLAEKLERREINHAIFEASVTLQDGPLSPADKVRFADDALLAAPGWAPFHLHKGEALTAMNQKAKAEGAFRNGLTHSPDPDTETRLRLGLAATLDAASAERFSLLEEAITLNGNLTSAAMARVLLRGTAS
jgi:tetratricopeptide (TPR) repeat protein